LCHACKVGLQPLRCPCGAFCLDCAACRRFAYRCRALLALPALVTLPAFADSWPNKPVHILGLAQCATQDREERAKWAEYVKIARIEPQ
jgi:hypothetical protein